MLQHEPATRQQCMLQDAATMSMFDSQATTLDCMCSTQELSAQHGKLRARCGFVLQNVCMYADSISKSAC